MPTPPNSPAAPRRHRAQTAPPAKQPLHSNRRASSTGPHTIVPESAAKPVEPVVEKKSFFSNFFKK